jgi:hypothetical protein
MDLGDIIGVILDLVVDVEWLRFWRFWLCLASALALAGLLDFLTGDHVPGVLLYVAVGLFGAVAGILWETSDGSG